MDSLDRPLPTTRRNFLKATTAAAMALAMSRRAPARVLGANDRITFGVVGCGGTGDRTRKRVGGP